MREKTIIKIIQSFVPKKKKKDHSKSLLVVYYVKILCYITVTNANIQVVEPRGMK